MAERFEVRVATDGAALARQVAERVQALSREAVAPLAAALSGGSTPRRLYSLLAQEPYCRQVRWERLEFFFGDERAVASDHPESNYRMAREALFDQVEAIVHPMPAASGDADAYERLIRERLANEEEGVPVFDLVLLGLGQDGHTASLFPGTAALAETKRLVVMNHPEGARARMTFTYPLINAARRVWVLAPGADKREIVAQCRAARERGADGPWPILRVRPVRGELIWWLDQASAGAA